MREGEVYTFAIAVKLTNSMVVSIEDCGDSVTDSIKHIMSLFGKGAFNVDIATEFIDENDSMGEASSSWDGEELGVEGQDSTN